MKDMMNNFPLKGTVEWMSYRPHKRKEVTVTNEISVTVDDGIEGDHYSNKNKKRQVTLFQAEYLPMMASFLGKEKIDPTLLRRNIMVSGINLNALKDKQFKIGDEVILEVTGECHPCSRMEENLGLGGYNAMRSHGGLTTKVIQGGKIRIGDAITFFKKI